MAVRDLNVRASVPRVVRWLPIAAVLLVIVSGVLSQGQSVRYQDFSIRSSAPKWFDVRSPNGSYGFVAVTAPKPTKTPKAPPPPPDSDGDGIPDSNDACPSVPGTADFQGCPPPTPTPKPILPSLPATGACVLATQSGLSVNVRQEPATGTPIVGSISYSQIVPVLAQTVNDNGETWYQIAAGFVAARVVRLGGDCSGLQSSGAAEASPTGAPPPDSGAATSAPASVASGPVAVDKSNSVASNSRGILQLHDSSTGQLEFVVVQNGDAAPMPDFGVGGVIFPALQPTGTGVVFFTGDPSGLTDLRLADLNQPGQSTVILSARTDLRIAPFPPAWSPDGSSLLVTLVDPVTNTSGIYRLTLQNGALVNTQMLVSNAFAPTFSHDGSFIAYVTGSLLSRTVQVMSLADNSTQAITGTAPFSDCTAPVFGLSPTDLLFVCNAAGQILLVRANGGTITPVAAPVNTFVSVVSTASGAILVSDGRRVYAAPLNALVFTPLIDSGGKIIEYMQWLQGEGVPAG